MLLNRLLMLGLSATLTSNVMIDTETALISQMAKREEVNIEYKSIKDEFENQKRIYDEEQRKIAEEQERLRLEEQERQRIENERIEEERKKKPHFNPNNLREPSNLSVGQIHKILDGNALQTLSNAYYWAEKEYGVNTLFLIALNREESGNGRSALAISSNNLGGIKSRNGGYRYFNDWGECLNYLANMIDKEYLSRDGAFYNGVSIWNVETRYCETSGWGDRLSGIANEMLSKVE